MITREEAINRVKGYLTDIIPIDGYSEVDEIVKALKQEPKTGYWTKSKIGGAKVCSVCKAHMVLSNFNFCPNCGAKMSESEG